MPIDHRTRIAERVEAELFFGFGALAPEHTARALGITTARIGGGVVLSVRDDPMGTFWNRALGLGLTEPVTDRLIGEVVDFHRTHGSPGATFQIAPELLPADWDEITARYGLTTGGTIVKHVASVDDVVSGTPASALASASASASGSRSVSDPTAEHRSSGPATDLRIGPVTAEHVDEWSERIWQIFTGGSQPHLAAIMASGLRQGAFRGFAAWDGDAMVAVANLFVDGETAHLNCGATLSGHRRHGAQSALIAARIQAAAEAGCRWLVVETDRPEQPGGNPSRNNLVRVGIPTVYERTHWIWRPDRTAA